MAPKAKKGGAWEEFERVKIAGREFWKIPRAEINKLTKMIRPDQADDPREDDGPDFLIPCSEPDDYVDFPGTVPLDDAGFLIKAGIATHSVDRIGFETRKNSLGLSARQLGVFSELDWYGECFSVLEAHGWTDHGNVLPSLIEKVAAAEGRDLVPEMKARFGNEWQPAFLEVAAVHLAEPLSRLWYVCNMMALYYIHQDDMRVGYLWCEYQMRKRYELFALKHIELTEKNRESGLKGGQGDKKQQRYAVLNRLANDRFKDIAFASDREGIRLAKRLAADHDAKSGDNLFSVNGKVLSSQWFGEWLDQFRLLARGLDNSKR